MRWRLERGQVVPSLRLFLPLHKYLSEVLHVNQEISDALVRIFWTEQVVIGALKGHIFCNVVLIGYTFLIAAGHGRLALLVDEVWRNLCSIWLNDVPFQSLCVDKGTVDAIFADKMSTKLCLGVDNLPVAELFLGKSHLIEVSASLNIGCLWSVRGLQVFLICFL